LTTVQMAKMFLNYTDRHPEQWEWNISVVVALALMESFPCNR
jgi:hypothetical protein